MLSKSPSKSKIIRVPKRAPKEYNKMAKNINNLGYNTARGKKFKDFPITLTRNLKPLRPGHKPTIRK